MWHDGVKNTPVRTKYHSSHYNLVAEVINLEEDAAVRERFAQRFINLFKADNPNFIEGVFKKVCRVQR